MVIATGAPDELGIGSMRLTDPPRRPGPADVALVVTLEARRGKPAGSRVIAVSRDVVAAQMTADPAIDSVQTIEREDGSSALVARFADADEAERQQAAIRLTDAIDPGPLEASAGGEVARLLEARRELEQDLWRPMLVVAPLALLLLGAAAGWRRAAAPILCIAIAIAGSLALLRVLGLVADVSLLGFAPAAAIGLVLGIELPLLLIGRYEAEVSAAEPDTGSPDALGADARSILLIGAVATLPAFAALATPLEQALSLAVGCALAALLAAASTIVVTPAVLALADRRTRPDSAAPGPLMRLTAALGDSGVLSVAILLLAAAALCVLALPALDGITRPLGVLSAAPGDSLFGELVLPAAIAAVALALVGLVHSPLALILGAVALLPAAAAAGACVFVLQQGHLATLLDWDAQAALDTGSIAVTLWAVGSICAARAAAAALGPDADPRTGGTGWTLRAAAFATVVGALAAGALASTELHPARELGVAIAFGLLADLILLRVPMVAFARRWVG